MLIVYGMYSCKRRVLIVFLATRRLFFEGKKTRHATLRGVFSARLVWWFSLGPCLTSILVTPGLRGLPRVPALTARAPAHVRAFIKAVRINTRGGEEQPKKEVASR